ncbi:glycosyltransferase family 4 protein [Allohahella marinimesophila]|uniref:Glycosyltransferase family 4 protein n=1 Tax=Allohahella marinimesophila TaxID=1054972 RepID=A0ABP7PR57_9GAMM
MQVLPELQSGGVERGTIEFSRYLVEQGHRSTVISNGGRLVRQLEADGGHHISIPIHRKSPASLRYVAPLRQALFALHPDIVHVRSRMPAWLTWLAMRKFSERERPVVVSTFHGLYSVNRYSAIMSRANAVIAISRCVRDYIVDNYRLEAASIKVIPRGVDIAQFPPRTEASAEWTARYRDEFPLGRDRFILLMPGRLTRWKGQLDFLKLIASLKHEAPGQYYGVIVGEPDQGKTAYLDELTKTAQSLGIMQDLAFAGHRSDMTEWYAAASAVFNLSTQPEPFGRTVVEALATGTPVIAYDQGGPAEVLEDIYPAGLVKTGDLAQLARQTRALCEHVEAQPPIEFGSPYTLAAQSEATLAVYRSALSLNN